MRKLTAFCLITAAMFLFSCQGGSSGNGAGGGAMGKIVSPDNQISILKGIISQDPKNKRAWIDLGNVSMDTGRYQDAIDAYRAALKLDPRDLDVRVDMGTCYRSIGNPQKAFEEYKKVLHVDPNHAIATRNMGVVLAYDLHKKQEAREMFEKYLKMNPNAPDAAGIRQEIDKLKGD
ncbi:MAG: tetratricopeptide repeat protein [Nitrospiraceae bacterium]|nr:tetratricopeptide repeat protein [Nitrospiraceae bacterium]